MNFLKSETYRSGIIQSVILNAFSKAVTFFNAVLITYFFGVSLQTDIYYYIFSIVALIAGFITVINSAVLIPEAMRRKEKGFEEEAMAYINRYTLAHVIIGIAVSLPLLLIPEQIFLSVSKFELASLVQHKPIIQLLVLLLPLMIITQHLKDILGMYKYFSLSIILTIINSICSIVLLLIFSDRGSLLYAVAGLVIGYLINVILLGYILFVKIKWKLIFNSHFPVASKKGVYLWYFSNLISLPCASIYLYLMPGLGDGYLTSYSLALQVSLIPVQFVLAQIISVLTVKFNELFARDDKEQIRQQFHDSTDFTLFMMCGVAGIVFINSREIIYLLFERGNFSEASGDLTSFFLQYHAVTLPFLVLANFTSIFLTASQQVTKAFKYQISANLMLVLFCAGGYYFWQATGFMIGLIAYNVVNNVMMRILFTNHNYIDYNKSLISLTYYFVICGIAGGICLFIGGLIDLKLIFIQLLVKTLLFTAIVLFAVYIFSLNKVFFNEVNRMVSSLRFRYK